MNRVLVMMSTYNGEKYIKEQLDSILKQENVDVYIYIRDDGSKDNTVGIIKEYVDRYSNIEFCAGENLKPAKSFMWLAVNCNKDEFDFFAFSDQDDIWLNDKLCCAVSKLEQYKYIPAIYYCAAQNTDKDLNKLDILYTEKKHTNSLIDSMAKGSMIPGCTMVFNKQLMDLIALYSPHSLTMHDTWTHLVCISCGGIVVSDELPHILYRQHENNVIGSNRKSVFYRYNDMKSLNNKYSKMISELLCLYSDKISEDKKTVLTVCSKYRISFKHKIVFLKLSLKNGLKNKDKMKFFYKILRSYY